MNVNCNDSLRSIASLFLAVADFELCEKEATNDEGGARAIEACRQKVIDLYKNMTFYELTAAHKLIEPLRIERIRTSCK